MKKYLSLFIFSFLFFACKIFAMQIDINSASLQELDGLAGIGPKYAQAIIDARPFSSVEDLGRVKGIGPKTLEKIKLQGYACVDCQTNLTPQATAIYPSGIFINEILPAPKGADETDEWFEIYNANNFEADLSGWKLQNTAGTTDSFTIPQNTKISAFGYMVFKRPDTKIMLHNTGDSLQIIWPNGKTEDSADYPKSPTGQSYNKIGANWSWSQKPTPGAENIVAVPAQKKTPTSAKNANPAETQALPKYEKSDNNINIDEAGLANISQNKNPWVLFFIVLAVTAISALSVIYIKLKFLKK